MSPSNAVVCACPADFKGDLCEQAVTAENNTGLSPGAQAGIAVGVVLMLLIAAGAVVAFFVLTKRNPFKKNSQKGSTMQLTGVTSESVIFSFFTHSANENKNNQTNKHLMF